MKLGNYDMNRSRWIGGITLLAVVAVIAAMTTKIPYSFTVPGKVLCTHEWIVTRNADGGIATFVADHASGIAKNYTQTQFSRGDAVQFSLDARVASGAEISKGDTIGVVRSSEVERELERLRGELQSATAMLAVTVTGEKQSVVEEARQAVEYAKRQAEDLKAILARQKLLHERGLIAQQEYELAERRASTAAIDVSMAEARLRSVSTGAKQQQADLVRSQIKSLQREIEVLERQEQGHRLISPLSGIVTQVGAGDTLLVVADPATYVVIMPVPVHERSSLAAQQPVHLYASDVQDIPSAAVTHVDKTIHALNGQQVVLVTAQMQQATDEMLNGLLARCSIECASVPAFEYFRKKLHMLLR